MRNNRTTAGKRAVKSKSAAKPATAKGAVDSKKSMQDYVSKGHFAADWATAEKELIENYRRANERNAYFINPATNTMVHVKADPAEISEIVSRIQKSLDIPAIYENRHAEAPRPGIQSAAEFVTSRTAAKTQVPQGLTPSDNKKDTPFLVKVTDQLTKQVYQRIEQIRAINGLLLSLESTTVEIPDFKEDTSSIKATLVNLVDYNAAIIDVINEQLTRLANLIG